MSNPKSERRTYDVKEIVTGFLGIVIVIATLVLTGVAFSMAGEETKMQDAMRVLTLLFGLSGVVVGYYFGRVPAEKRADAANGAKDRAIEDRTAIINRANEIHNEMQGSMDKAGLTPSMLQDGNFTPTPQQLEQITKTLAQAHAGISNMTKDLPSSARS